MFMVCVRVMFQWNGSELHGGGHAKGRLLLFSHDQICWIIVLGRSTGIVSWCRKSIASTLTTRVWDWYYVNVLQAIPLLWLKKIIFSSLGFHCMVHSAQSTHGGERMEGNMLSLIRRCRSCIKQIARPAKQHAFLSIKYMTCEGCLTRLRINSMHFKYNYVS